MNLFRSHIIKIVILILLLGSGGRSAHAASSFSSIVDSGLQLAGQAVEVAKQAASDLATFAQGNTSVRSKCVSGLDSYCLLAPIDPSQQGRVAISVEGFSSYLKLMFRYAVGFAGVLTVFILIYAGIEYIGSGANITKKESAESRMWAALTGLILALTSYLILNTLNPELVNFKLRLEPIKIQATRGGIIQPISTFVGSGVQAVGKAADAAGTAIGADTVETGERAVRDQLIAGKVDINNAPCPAGTKSFQDHRAKNGIGCTNVKGLTQNAIDNLIALRKICNCTVMVNGGTEPGHSANGGHPDGVSVDLKLNGVGKPMSQFIFGNAKEGPGGAPANLGKTYNIPQLPGALFLLETKTASGAASSEPHWHVRFFGAAPQ